MMRCGSCGLMVTAEEKMKRSGRRYVYYHCTKRRPNAMCREPYAPVGKIEEGMEQFLADITISDEFHAFALARIAQETKNVETSAGAERAGLEKALRENENALRNLRLLRVREQITEEEFLADRQNFDRERLQLQEQLAEENPAEAFEPAKLFLSFSNRALKWFREGDEEVRRLIIETAGSNPLLKARILNIDGLYPFRRSEQMPSFPELWAKLDDIRTRRREERVVKFVACVKRLLDRLRPNSLDQAA
jgi:site-specific DNA recombinase